MQKSFSSSNSIFSRLLPFCFMGGLIIIAIIAFVLVSYLIFWSCVVGLILFLIAWVKNKFFRKNKVQHSMQQGRLYEHDDIK